MDQLLILVLGIDRERVTGDTLIRGGKLLVHELLDSTAPSKPALVSTSYEYKELGTFPNNSHTAWVNPPGSNYSGTYRNMWTWVNGRLNYLYDNRRFNLHKKTTKIHEYTFIKTIDDYSIFNKPLKVVESYKVNGQQVNRSKTIEYDNSHQSKDTWFVGAPAKIKTELASGPPLVESFKYNTYGLMSERVVAGIKTTYFYNGNGALFSETNANGNVTQYPDYKLGVPTRVLHANGGVTTRAVDNFGNITAENDPENHQIDYEYNDHYKRLSKTDLNDTSKDPIVAYPNWRNSNSPDYRKKREIVGSAYQKHTKYDSLGRVVLTWEKDMTNGNIRQTKSRYDVMGNLVFVSDPSSVVYQDRGTAYTYDAYGRMIESRHFAG